MDDNTVTLDEAMMLIGITVAEVEQITEKDEPRWDNERRCYILDDEEV